MLLCLTGCLHRNPAFDEAVDGGGSSSGGPVSGATSSGEGSSGEGSSGEPTGGVCGTPGAGGGVDADGDGQRDDCDPCVNDPADDADGDGLCADVDPCPEGPETADADGDGMADACDPCPMDAGDDGDGDGLCDAVDACPGSDDALDGDADGLPDGCDQCPQDPGNDADGDGVCGEIDNCPATPNAGQGDGDGDGRGDECDVCKDPAFPDDQADGDGDGIPCEADPCLFDGPLAQLPGSVGPFGEITISNAKINGGGNLAIVAPGADVALQYTWKVNFCECPNCYTQAMVGIWGHPPTQCFWNLGSDYNCKPSQNTAMQVFKAPMQPGTYFFRFTRDYEVNKCVTDKQLGPETAFAAICVK